MLAFRAARSDQARHPRPPKRTADDVFTSAGVPSACRRPVVDVMIGVAHPMVVGICARRVFRISGVSRPEPKQAFDAADNTAYRAADNRADRAGSVHADGAAMRDPVGNALGLRSQRQSKRCGDSGCKQNVELHATTSSSIGDGREVLANRGDCAALAWQRAAHAAIRRQ